MSTYTHTFAASVVNKICDWELLMNKNKNNTVRTDEPTPGTLALIGDSRASLSHIVAWVDHTGGRS